MARTDQVPAAAAGAGAAQRHAGGGHGVLRAGAAGREVPVHRHLRPQGDLRRIHGPLAPHLHPLARCVFSA